MTAEWPPEDFPPTSKPRPVRGWKRLGGLSYISAADLARELGIHPVKEEFPPPKRASNFEGSAS